MHAASRRAGVRAGRPAARRPGRAAAGDGEADRRVRRRHRRRRGRVRRRPAGGRGPGLPRPRRPGARPARLGGGEDRGPDHRRPGAPLLHPGLRRRAGRGRRPARAAGAGAAGRRRRARRLAERSTAGSRVTIRVPQRGDKKALLETVARNAERGADPAQAAPRRRPHHAQPGAGGDRRRRSAWTTAPLRIECYDVSQIQGTDVVASMVVFEDGLARKSEYRRFVDHAAPPTTCRRSPRCCAAGSPATSTHAPRPASSATRRLDPDRPGIDPTTGRPRKFAYPPQLVVVDGGAPQVNAAARGARRPGHRRRRACAGWPSGWRRCGCRTSSSRSSCRARREGLYLLQRVRDEAHRFAITFHRQRRSKRMTVVGARRRPGPRRGPAQGAAAALRLGQAAGRGERRGDRRGAGHRPAHRRGDPGRARRRRSTAERRRARRQALPDAPTTPDRRRRA